MSVDPTGMVEKEPPPPPGSKQPRSISESMDAGGSNPRFGAQTNTAVAGSVGAVATRSLVAEFGAWLASAGTAVAPYVAALLMVSDASPAALAQQKAKEAKADDAKKDADTTDKPKTEATPTTHPDNFKPVKGTKAKKNPDTGEVWEKDKLHKDHYEVYKNRKQFDKGVRDRDVWEDGRPKRFF